MKRLSGPRFWEHHELFGVAFKSHSCWDWYVQVTPNNKGWCVSQLHYHYIVHLFHTSGIRDSKKTPSQKTHNTQKKIFRMLFLQDVRISTSPMFSLNQQETPGPVTSTQLRTVQDLKRKKQPFRPTQQVSHPTCQKPTPKNGQNSQILRFESVPQTHLLKNRTTTTPVDGSEIWLYNHLGSILKKPVNNGRNTLPTSTGFLNHQQYWTHHTHPPKGSHDIWRLRQVLCDVFGRVNAPHLNDRTVVGGGADGWSDFCSKENETTTKTMEWERLISYIWLGLCLRFRKKNAASFKIIQDELRFFEQNPPGIHLFGKSWKNRPGSWSCWRPTCGGPWCSEKKNERFYYTETDDQFNPLTHGCHEKLNTNPNSARMFSGKISKKLMDVAIKFDPPPPKKKKLIPYV